MGKSKSFFDIGININREEADRKLAEYHGIGKPSAGAPLDQPSLSCNKRLVVERSAFQRRLRWVLFRLFKLGVAVGVSAIAMGVFFILSNTDSIHCGEFEHRFQLGDADVAMSDPDDIDGFAVKITKDDGTCALYERTDGGVWKMTYGSEAPKSPFKKLFTTGFGSICAYSGKGAGRLTVRLVDQDGKVIGYALEGPKRFKRLVGNKVRIPAHEHSLLGLSGEMSVYLSGEGEVLLRLIPEQGQPTFWTLDGEKGFELVNEKETARLHLEKHQWTKKHPNVKLLRMGNMLHVQRYASEGWLKGGTTINTAAGTYIEFGLAGTDPKTRKTAPDRYGRGGVHVSEAISSLVTIALLLFMFRRDFRLLARYLGRPMRPRRALLTATGAAVAAKVVSGVGALLLVMLAFLFHGGPVGGAALQIPENFRHPMNTVSDNAFSIIAGLSIVPAAEELIFRGALFLICLRLFGKRAAVLATSALFVLFHYSTYSMVPMVILMLAVSGISAALVLLWTHRLRWSIAFHSASNALAIALWSAFT